jgi:protein O-GlcNAc transferase
MSPDDRARMMQEALEHQRGGRRAEAEAVCGRILQEDPGDGEALNLLGLLYAEGRDYRGAIDALSRAVAARGDIADFHHNLGTILADVGRLEEAIAAYRRALEINPHIPETHGNLGNALKDLGRTDEAIACYRRALAIKGDFAGIHSDLLYALHFSPEYGPAEILEEHRRWAARHAQPLAGSIRPHDNDRSPQRRLRLGYLSPDFRDHVAGWTLEPVLAAHDRAGFEVFCYSAAAREDAFTARLAARADHWRPLAGLSHEQAAQLIRDDRIDILVDLALHSGSSQMLLFALKPAPVQVTHLGYASTTGLTAIDYRITDGYLDPPGSEAYSSERLVRLPHCFWCYAPQAQMPPPGDPPCLANGYVTFGCLNHSGKVTAASLEMWGGLLQRVPTAHLAILAADAGGGDDPRVRELVGRGIAAGRMHLLGRCPYRQYLELHLGLDVALDPTPYSGGITTCDALWMGVPVVTLAGRTSVGRGGVSLLSNLGLGELIAGGPEEYLDIAAGLAADPQRLARLRRELHPRMEASPIMDAQSYTRDLESAYGQMWRNWCASISPSEPGA